MAIDADTFKAILSCWASGITVVTCRRPDGDRVGVHGMTASAFCGVSLEPPLVLVCVDRHAKTHDYLREQGAFGVHILSSDMREIADRCAGFHGEDGHSLDHLSSRAEVTGAPILDGVLAWMDCALWRAYEGGDHTLYVGKIQAGGAREGSPLVWCDRGYRLMK